MLRHSRCTLVEIDDDPGGDWFRLALETQRSHGTEIEHFSCGKVSTLPNENRIGRGHLLQSGSNVDSITCDEKIVSGGLDVFWGSDFAGVDANAHLQLRRLGILSLSLLVEVGKGLLHIECGAYGAVRIIFMSDRRSKDGHDGIADIFLYSSSMASYLFGHEVEVAGQDSAHIFRVQAVRQWCRADDISEHDGDDTPFLWQCQPTVIVGRCQGWCSRCHR